MIGAFASPVWPVQQALRPVRMIYITWKRCRQVLPVNYAYLQRSKTYGDIEWPFGDSVPRGNVYLTCATENRNWDYDWRAKRRGKLNWDKLGHCPTSAVENVSVRYRYDSISGNVGWLKVYNPPTAPLLPCHLQAPPPPLPSPPTPVPSPIPSNRTLYTDLPSVVR